MKKAIAALLSAVILSIPMTSFAAILAKEMPDDLYADGFDYYSVEEKEPKSEYTKLVQKNRLYDYEDDEGNTFKIYILEDKMMKSFYRAFSDGRAIFDIELPQEKVSDISSDGKVTVLLQNYKQYSLSVIDGPKAAEYSEPAKSKLCTALIKGDLGEKEYRIQQPSYSGNGEIIDDKYYYRMICMPIIHHDNEVIVSKVYGKVGNKDGGYERDESGNFVYCDRAESAKNGGGDVILGVYSSYHKVEDYMQIVYELENDKYYGIKSIGVGFSDGSYYTVPAEEAKIDFDFETAVSSSYIQIGRKAIVENNIVKGYKILQIEGEIAAEKVAELRDERSVNNELENILTIEDVESMRYGDDKQPEQSQPKYEPEEENKEEETKQPEEDTPEPSFPESTGEVKVNIDENELDFDGQKPVIDNDRVLVPMRKIFETLGAEVTWDAEAQTVTAQKGDAVVTLEIGKNEITKNGITSQLDTSARILNDRTLVPIRAISESFGNDVTWNPETNTVEIKK